MRFSCGLLQSHHERGAELGAATRPVAPRSAGDAGAAGADGRSGDRLRDLQPRRRGRGQERGRSGALVGLGACRPQRFGRVVGSRPSPARPRGSRRRQAPRAATPFPGHARALRRRAQRCQRCGVERARGGPRRSGLERPEQGATARGVAARATLALGHALGPGRHRPGRLSDGRRRASHAGHLHPLAPGRPLHRRRVSGRGLPERPTAHRLSALHGARTRHRRRGGAHRAATWQHRERTRDRDAGAS